jgi:hypothetical protein
MQEISTQLQEQLPDWIYAFIKANPEIEYLQWVQSSIRGEGFSVGEVTLEISEDASEERIEEINKDCKEFEVTLRSIPSSVMIEVFGHSHEVTCYEDNFETEYYD